MARNPSKMPSQRQLRVGEQIRHILAQSLIRGDFGNRLLIDHGSEISVSEVRISPDLKNATAFVVALGNTLDMDEVLPALNAEIYSFQKQINNGSNLRNTPKLKFVYDPSFDEGSRIDHILSQIYIPPDDENEA